MDPVLQVVLALALFAGTHIGLGWPSLRQRLVDRLGRWGFTGLFTVVAWLSFGVVAATYAANADQGPAGPGLGAGPAARALGIGAICLGVMMMTAAFATYARSPYAASGHAVREPRGLERVTRHPFFVGVALLGAAHVLLATHLTGAVLMGGLAIFAWVGARFQDRKLLALRGEPYAAYLAATSTVPFAAILAGRARFVAAEMPYALLALGLGLAWGLRQVHAHLFDHGGAYVITALVVGPLVILLGERRREQRMGTPSPPLAME